MSGYGGQRERYVPPTEFRVGGNPPGGAVRRLRGNGGLPAEVAIKAAPKNVCTQEPGPPTYRPSTAANLALLLGRSSSPELPEETKEPEELSKKIPEEPIVPDPVAGSPELVYSLRVRGVTNLLEKIDIWEQILREERDAKQ